jgi:hypothetical protein
MKIRPMDAELFHADGQTDKANSRFSQLCEKRLLAKKIYQYIYNHLKTEVQPTVETSSLSAYLRQQKILK